MGATQKTDKKPIIKTQEISYLEWEELWLYMAKTKATTLVMSPHVQMTVIGNGSHMI